MPIHNLSLLFKVRRVREEVAPREDLIRAAIDKIDFVEIKEYIPIEKGMALVRLKYTEYCNPIGLITELHPHLDYDITLNLTYNMIENIQHLINLLKIDNINVIGEKEEAHNLIDAATKKIDLERPERYKYGINIIIDNKDTVIVKRFYVNRIPKLYCWSNMMEHPEPSLIAIPMNVKPADVTVAETNIDVLKYGPREKYITTEISYTDTEEGVGLHIFDHGLKCTTSDEITMYHISRREEYARFIGLDVKEDKIKHIVNDGVHRPNINVRVSERTTITDQSTDSCYTIRYEYKKNMPFAQGTKSKNDYYKLHQILELIDKNAGSVNMHARRLDIQKMDYKRFPSKYIFAPIKKRYSDKLIPSYIELTDEDVNLYYTTKNLLTHEVKTHGEETYY